MAPRGGDRRLRLNAVPRRGHGSAAFATASAGLFLASVAAGVPAPLYVTYQRDYGVSFTALSGAFAIYIVPLVAALLTCATLSDHLGRRRVAVPALLLGALGCLVLVTVDSAAPLLAGRALQGLSVGLALSALGALVADLAPVGVPAAAGVVNSGAPPAGIATGALVSGTVATLAPGASWAIYTATAALLVLSAAGVAALPETVARRPGVLRALRPSVRVPAAVRPFFRSVCFGGGAGYVLGGFTQALSPSLAADAMGQDSRLSGGLAVATLHLAVPVAGTLSGRLGPRAALVTGVAVMVLGVAGLAAAVAAGSFAAFLPASAVAGAGFGATFAASLRTVLDRCAPDERAGSLAAVYLVCYVGAAVSSLLAGTASEAVGVAPTATVLYVVVVVLALAALVRPRGSGARRARCRDPARC